MEPIKIEFLMGGNLRDGLKEAGNELEALIDKCAKLRRTITGRSEYSMWSKQIEYLEELMSEHAQKGNKSQVLFIKYFIAQLKHRRLFTKGAYELYGDNPKLLNKKKIEAYSEWKRIE